MQKYSKKDFQEVIKMGIGKNRIQRKFKCVAVYFVCVCVFWGSLCNTGVSIASESNERSVREYYDAVNSGDLQALYDTLGDSYLHDAKEIYEDQENRENHVAYLILSMLI